jgi:uncharacterized protein
MKTKKPRSGKAVKPAARSVRRVPLSKRKTLRRKPSPAKVKGAKSKTTKKPKLPARKKTRSPIKSKAPKKRIIRKPKVKVPSIPVESAQIVASVVAVPEQAPEAVPAEQAEPGLRIPKLLLEDDEPAVPPITGPGQKYALGPAAPAAPFEREEADLPAAYGTQKLLLAARDPHWLYAHWDLTPEQQRRYNSLSADHHLVLRVYTGAGPGQTARDVHVHPESRHWFVHVERGGTEHVAKLGYYRPRHRWVTIATSSPAKTPAATASADQTVRFATIPAHVRLTQLAALAAQTIPADLPPADAARERALAELVSRQLVEQTGASSEQIPELVRGRSEQGSSAAAGGLPAPLGGEAESVSSPAAPEEQRPAGFWLNVNAELVIYGGTEPGASVTIGGRPVQLRPDGTFSCRCSIPDGGHTVTVSALSAQGELRQAELQFSRHTTCHGEVAPAPQDPSLEPPPADQP